jgi:glycosyltransferase involved in cell wall biosynthesis
MLDQITPLVLTYNEAPNIGRTLEQLRWARDIVVVDSFSDDQTLEIIAKFPQARMYQRQFDSHENQWNFGLKETGIESEWVLGLDADYVLTDEVTAEVSALTPPPDVQGYRAKFIYCINGKRIVSGIYPPVTVLYRRIAGNYLQDGHTHKLKLNGRVENLLVPILHDDRKPLSCWFAAQSRYTKLEAEQLLSSEPASLSWTDRIRRWRVVAPPAMLFYCLIVRGGVFDGWAGFYYAFQRALAELMLSLYLIEQSAKGKEQSAVSREKNAKSKEQMETTNTPGAKSNGPGVTGNELRENETSLQI